MGVPWVVPSGGTRCRRLFFLPVRVPYAKSRIPFLNTAPFRGQIRDPSTPPLGRKKICFLFFFLPVAADRGGLVFDLFITQYGVLIGALFPGQTFGSHFFRLVCFEVLYSPFSLPHLWRTTSSSWGFVLCQKTLEGPIFSFVR